MDLHLTGKIAVVTGASRGIGLAVTRALAAEGATVVAGARTTTTELSDLAARAAVHPVPVDLATPGGPAHLIRTAVAAHGGLDILVNNVGAVRPRTGGFLYGAAKAALANFSKALSKEVAPHGVRVTTVSPGPVATALWLGPDGVATTVAAAAGANPDGVVTKAAGESATGRFTEPDEVADLVLLLASNRAANVTGTDITIDGGLITTL